MTITADPAQFADRIVKSMMDEFRPSMEAMGKEELLGGMQTLVSVPVQYVSVGSSRPAKPKPIGNKPGPGLRNRPGVGHAVVRSKRGESPRKEFGFLYRSMKTETTVRGLEIITTVWSDNAIAGYSARLEEQLDRPHFSTILDLAQRFAVAWILARAPQTI